MYIHPYYAGLIGGFIITILLEFVALFIAAVVTTNRRNRK